MPRRCTRDDFEPGADQQGTFAHAPDSAGGILGGVRTNTDAVVVDHQLDLLLVGGERHVRLRGLGVADDIGQRLLCDAVDHQLGVRTQRWYLAVERAPDDQPGSLLDAIAQVAQRGHEPERVEHLGPEPASEPAHALERFLGRGLGGGELVTQLWRGGAREAVDLQHQRGQPLADLVVQLGGDAPPLRLLSHQRAVPAFAPFGFEPVEHRVERVRQAGHLRLRAECRQPSARVERIDRVHQAGQALQRSECAPHEHEVDRQQHSESAGQRDDAAVRRLDHQHDARAEQHGGVGHEQPPEERDVRRRGPARAREHQIHVLDATWTWWPNDPPMVVRGHGRRLDAAAD